MKKLNFIITRLIFKEKMMERDNLTRQKLFAEAEEKRTKKYDSEGFKEVLSERGKNTRVFENAEGQRRLLIGNGVTEGVEKKRLLSEDETGFSTQDLEFSAKFNKNADSAELLRIEVGGCSIAMGMPVAAGTTKKRTSKKIKNIKTDDISDNIVSFTEVLPDTDIEYTVENSSVKENIVVKKKQGGQYSYTFPLVLEGVTGKLSEDCKSVSFADESGKNLFRIPGPIMFDAAGKLSSDIVYNLKDDDLTITASADWINAEDRAFPVTIDPSVVLNAYYYINFKQNDSQYSDLVYLGYGEYVTGEVNVSGMLGTYGISMNNVITCDLYMVAYGWNNYESYNVTTKNGSYHIGTYTPYDGIYTVPLRSIWQHTGGNADFLIELNSSYSYEYFPTAWSYIELTYTASAKILNSISITTQPTKRVYTEGESFNPAGMVVRATYSDGSSANVTGYTYSPTTLTGTGTKTITISYTQGGITRTATLTITVNAAVVLNSISIITPPAKRVYTAGESFDKTGMVVIANYSNNTYRIITDYTYSPAGALTTEDTQVIISYQGKSVSQDITVNTPIELSRIDISKQPTKKVYTEGDSFDPASMIVEATFTNGSTEVITGYTWSPTTLYGIGTKTITVRYTHDGVTKADTLTVTVNAAVTLGSITVAAKNKYKYYYVDNIITKADLEVTANYSDGSSPIVPAASYSFSDYKLKAGVNKIYVTYSGKIGECEFYGCVLEVVKASPRAYYVESKITKLDLRVTLNTISGTQTISAANYTFAEFNLASGNNAATISYDGESRTCYFYGCKVTVDKANSSRVYYVGQSITKADLIVKVETENGTQIVDAANYTFIGFELISGNNIATISYDGVTKTCAFFGTIAKTDTSKVNQTELDFSGGAGAAKVNLYTGRMLYECPQVSVGSGDYAIGVSLIYNSYFEESLVPAGLSTYMGLNWKLNVQQYIYQSANEYKYVDGSGMIHTFVYLKTSGNAEYYYDTSGLGLTLYEGNSIRMIYDNTGNMEINPLYPGLPANRMFFNDDGRLFKTLSAFGIEKNYSYISGKLMDISDSRNDSPKICFHYDEQSGLLDDMWQQENGIGVKLTYRDNMLTESIEYKGNTNSSSTQYSYDNSRLKCAADSLNNSGIKIEYTTDGRVSNVQTGVCTLSPVQTGFMLSSFSSATSGTIDYSGIPNYATVTNENNIKLVYYFNKAGFTVSAFEAHGGNLSDLRTLERMPGMVMLKNNGSTLINKQSVHNITTEYGISITTDEFKGVQKYRDNKCRNYYYFTCSFWLKIPTEFTMNTVKLKVNGESFYARFDATAVNAWQLVNVPLYIPDQNINSVSIVFDASGTKSIADMRLSYGTPTKFCLTNGTYWDAMEDIYSINSETIENNFYMSASDIQATYLNIFRTNGTEGITTGYTLVCCDGTKKFPNILNTSLRSRRGIAYTLKFGTDADYGTGRANYFTESKSPDGELCTFGIPMYYGTGGERIRQINQANKKVDNVTKKSSMEATHDLYGRIIEEIDEYKVTTSYSYDRSNLTSKIVSYPGMSEKLVFSQNTSKDYISITDSVSSRKSVTEYNPSIGSIKSVTSSGADGSSALKTTYGYDLFHSRVLSVTNGLGNGNYLGYDSKGRLSRISPYPLDSTDPKKYEYVISYDGFNRPSEYKLNGTRLALTEVDMSNRTLTSKRYRGSYTDITTTQLDAYGRTDKLTEIGVDTTFKRQDLWESAGAAEVVEMKDGFEGRTYTFTYDDTNRPTGYSYVNKVDNDIKMSINQTGPSKTKYDLNGDDYESEIRYLKDVFINPRIEGSKDYGFDFNGYHQISDYTYSYDDLGRLKGKIEITKHGNSNIAKVETVYVYSPGTLSVLIETTKVFTLAWDGWAVSEEYTTERFYDKRGNVLTETYKKNGSVPRINGYTYDSANRLKTENTEFGSREYDYNTDGSINTVKVSSNSYDRYSYDKGRLKSILTASGAEKHYNYDSYGNCTHYMLASSTDANTPSKANLEWHRGNLLRKYSNTTYFYNSQGILFMKDTTGGRTVRYYLDGAKILGEDWSDNKKLRYFYDITGVCGMVYNNNAYHFVKDIQGNVIKLLNDFLEIATYEYDAWGDCRVYKNGELNTDTGFIGNINPFRWKGMYRDSSTGFYTIGGRCYSHVTRGFIDGGSPETILSGASVIYGLNIYSVANPVNMGYNGDTIETSIPLVHDPEILSAIGLWWSGVTSWYSGLHWGWKIGIGSVLFAAAVGLTYLSGGALAPVFINFGVGVATGTVIGTGINLAMGADFGDALLNGFADSVLWSGAFAFASGAIRAGRYAYAYATKNADIMAKLFTHNKSATSVMLGHGDDGAITGYVAHAKAGGQTYFAMSQKQWAKLSIRFGGREGMWKINEAFLSQNLYKVFLRSHVEARINSFFAREIAYLLSQGIVL